MKTSFGFLTLGLCLIVPTWASPISIEDFSFEDNTLESGGLSNNLSPEWSETGGAGNENGFEELIPGFASAGTDHLGMTQGHAVWQDLSVSYQPDTTYTLKIAAGNRSGLTSAGNLTTYSLQASEGTTYGSGSLDASLLPPGTFADGGELVFDTATNPSAVGKTIRIRLSAGGAGRSHFDNIRLDAAPNIAPGTATLENSVATAVGSMSATLNGAVTDTGDDAPVITIFYGPANGGVDPSAWAFSETLIGARSGSFSTSVFGLDAASSYYFTARGTNSAGDSWAQPSFSFETFANSSTITQSPATAITATTANLTASVTESGGDTPTITFYYGTSDGGTSSGNWSNSAPLGPVSTSATANLGGLTPSTTYFFRAFATNSGGSSWTASSGNFTTAAVTPSSIVNRPVNNLSATSANLRGEITDTGSDIPTVTLFYGTTNGANDPGAWDSSIELGSVDGSYSRLVTGLTPATTYYFTASATNAAGISWAPGQESFDTPEALTSQVVINEIHYDPRDETSEEEFIELYNPSASSIDLSGWMITDALDFIFPPGTSIPSGGYLVIAENPTTLQSVYGVTALGPWSRGLGNDGEEIDLRDSFGTVQDQVEYAAGFPWPTGARGGGGSMELINPTLDNNLGGSWRSSGTGSTGGSEITYISESDTAWRYRKGTSEASSPISSWRTGTFTEDGSWLTGRAPIGFGDNDDNTLLNDMENAYSTVYLRHEFTINPLDIPQQLSLRLYVDDGAVVWINGQEVARAQVPGGELAYNSTGINHEAEWQEFILYGANRYLNGGTNVIAIHALNSGISSSDFSIDASLASNIPAPGSASPTPGSPNGSSATLTPPSIRQVEHFPASATSSDSVTITAKITDPDGMGAVTLDYQTVEPGSYIRIDDAAYETSWTTLTMRDDGTSGDLVSGDSIYTVVLPAVVQEHRRLVRYRIHFQDSEGTGDTAPYADDEQPNFAYFVYDSLPAWAGSFVPGGPVVNFPASVMDDLPVYHLIADSTDVRNSQYVSSSDAVHMSGTLVYEGKVYDHIEFENRGEGSTYISGKNKWRLHFNRARKFHARDNWGAKYESDWSKFNLQPNSSPWAAMNRGMAGLDESLTMRLYGMAGVPSPRTHYFSFRVIDSASETPTDQYAGDVWGLYLAMEQPNGSFLDDRNLADGNIYKIKGGAGDKKEQGNTQVTDSSDWDSFYSASNSAQTEQWWRDNMEMPGYYSMRSLNRLLGNVDIRFGYNHYFYHEPTEDKWHVMPWDLDMMYIAETQHSGVIRQQNSILNHSRLAIEMRNRAREIQDLVASDSTIDGGQIGQLIDEYAEIVNPQGQAITWADLDAFMWNRHPDTKGTLGVTSGYSNHKGNFFASPYTDSRHGGSYIRTLASQDHEGFVDYILKYTTDNYTGGSWLPGNGIPAGYGYEYLVYEANDPAIPNKPAVTYSGPTGFPVNQLSFTSGAFSDPDGNGTFGKMRWRIAKILAPGLTGYLPGTPRSYEIETIATSGDINAFTPSYFFPAEAASPGITYRVRVQHEDATGRTSHWSDPVEFVTGLPSIDLWRDNLVISEIMYHPADPIGGESTVSVDKDDYEFIELTNISGSLTLDLSDLDFTDGITFDFATATATSLAPGASILLVKNLAAFEARYGNTLPVVGEYLGSLSNGGEQITLSYAQNTPVIDFTYDDNAPWPTKPDGDGFSLVLVDPLSAPDHALPSNWKAGEIINGTPGLLEPDPSEFEQFLALYLTPEELADPAIAAPDADPDQDGISNILEYAFKGLPLVRDPPGALYRIELIDIESVTYLTITYRQRIPSDDLTYLPQISRDLADWDDGPSHLIELSSIDQGDGLSLVTVRSSEPYLEKNQQFGRVKITVANF